MSSVDKRVVQMEFDNKQFEQNIKETSRSLDQLDSKLQLQNGVKGFENVQRAADGMKLEGIASGVDSIKEKFSVMGVVAFSAIQRVTNGVMDLSSRLARGLTIQPLLDGLNEYTLKMNSIKTIQTNTLGKSSLKDINETLDELNTYADKTIYNFAEMTRNIGTFTAAGVGLKQSAESIKGIANLAAASGSSSQQASVAMYQLSQAISTGTVKLQDWNSVTNAGMGGKLFQNALKRSAKAFGTDVDGMIKKAGSFRESLREGWLTTEVLTKTLRNFTLFTEDMTEAQRKQTREMLAKEGYTKKQIAQIEQEAKAAEEAATKVKTFEQLIDTTKEELGSGWAKTWELIIGDLSEAEELWTAVSKVINGVIGGLSDARNQTLQMWKELGGRKDVLKGFENIFNFFKSIVTPIAEAFNEIFKPITGKDLAEASKNFKNFTETLKLSDETISVIKSTATNFFKVISGGLGILKNIGQAALNILGPLFEIASKVAGNVAVLGGSLLGGLGGIFSGIESGGDGLKTVSENIGNFISTLSQGIPTVESFKGALDGVGALISTMFTDISQGLSSIWSSIINTISNAGQGFSQLGEAFRKAFEPMGPILDKIGGFFSNFIANIQLSDITQMFMALVAALGAKGLFGILKKIKDIGDSAKEGFGIKDLFDSLGETLDSFKKKTISFDTKSLVAIGISIALLAGALAVIASLDVEGIGQGLAAITALLLIMTGVIALISAIDAGGKLKGVSAAFIGMALGISLLSGAISTFANMDTNQLTQGIVAFVAVLYSMVGAVAALAFIEKKSKGIGASMLAISVSMLVLAGALKVLASIDTDKLFIGIGAMALSLGILGGALAIFKGNIGAAASLVVVSAGVLVLSAALLALGSVPIDNIVVALATLFSTLLILGVLSGIFQTVAPSMLLVSAALIVFSIGALALAAALAALGSIPLEKIGVALLGLVGAILIMGAASAILAAFIPAMFGVGAAMIVFSAGALVLSAALAALGAIPLQNIVVGLIGLAGALTIIGVASVLLAPFIPAMIGLGAGLLVVSAGAIALSVALGLLGASIMLIISLFAPLPGMVAGAVNGMGAAISGGFQSMLSSAISFGGNLINGLISGILGGIGSLASTAANAVGGFIDAAGNAISGFFGVGEQASQKMSQGLEVGASDTEKVSAQIPQTAADSISANADAPAEAAGLVGEGITSALGESLNSEEATAGTDQLMANLTASLEDGKGTVGDIASSFGPEISSNMASGIDPSQLNSGISGAVTKSVDGGKKKAKNAKDIGKTMAKEAGKGASDNKSAAESGGKDIGQGLVNGIKSKTGPAGSAGYEIGRKALAEAKRAVKSKSPSREFHKLGVNIDEGLILGIKSMMDQVGYSGRDLGKTAVSATEKSIKAMSFALDSIDTAPTIRPVVDLSGIQSGVDAANSIFAGQSALQAQMAVTPSRFYDPNGTAAQATSKQVNNTISITLDYKAGADATQITQDIAAGLMKLSFMEA